MAYFVASIIAITSAMIIMLTRYEADDSSIMAELEQMKEMFIMVDGYANTYIESGESLESIDFAQLEDAGILLANSTINPADGSGGLATTMTLPNNEVVWHIIPNHDNENSSYELLVDMTANAGLMSKARFSESFIGREYCEKMLFGTFETTHNEYDDSTAGEEDFDSDGTGTNSDGIFSCTVFK